MTAGCHLRLAIGETIPRLAAVGTKANVTFVKNSSSSQNTILPGEPYSGTLLFPLRTLGSVFVQYSSRGFVYSSLLKTTVAEV